MSKTKGVLVFAKNNDKIDYVKQSYYLAKRIKQYLNVPVSIVTDAKLYVAEAFDDGTFDQVIPVKYVKSINPRTFKDGTMTEYRDSFKNFQRSKAYEYSPYDETLLMDSDIIICNDRLKNVFTSEEDFLIYKDSVDLATFRDQSEFEYISEASIDFYWATMIFFRKTEENKIFFELVEHVEENYEHYVKVYQLRSKMFRNDFAFSIAIHIMNGFQKGSFAGKMPGKLYHTLDKDILHSINDQTLLFLIEKEKYLGEYTLMKTDSLNVHVMNKFSLMRQVDKELYNE
jgi:hypothetical protein